ncbi:MAG: hypothetical protein ABR551_13355 [Gemmatimonadales bacterium]
MNKLLPGKAFLVCALGLFALFSAEDAVSSEAAVANKCGDIYCFSSLHCGEIDVEAWCAAHSSGCPGPIFCSSSTFCPPGTGAAVTCGDAEI